MSLEQSLARARADIETAQALLDAATRQRAEAREMAGGLLSFGPSGPQGAATKVRNATDRAMRSYSIALDKLADAHARERKLLAQIADRDRVRFTRDDLDGATFIRTRHGWWDVKSVNAKSVTVFTDYSWTERIEFDKVLEVRR